MRDAEVICAFMEAKPQFRSGFTVFYRGNQHAVTTEEWRSPGGWWRIDTADDDRKVEPRELELNALHEVEARLSDEQFEIYKIGLIPLGQMANAEYWHIHANVEDKTRVLAFILRREVEKRPA